MGQHLYHYHYNQYCNIINEIGIKQFTNTLFNGDINLFIEKCKPYIPNIYDYISYVDALFFNTFGGDFRLKESIDNDFLTVFYNNLKTLIIENKDLAKKEQLKDRLNHGNTTAYYLAALNKINLVGKCSKYDLFHELFHAASSKYIFSKKLTASGIAQYSKDYSIDIGCI